MRDRSGPDGAAGRFTAGGVPCRGEAPVSQHFCSVGVSSTRRAERLEANHPSHRSAFTKAQPADRHGSGQPKLLLAVCGRPERQSVAAVPGWRRSGSVCIMLGMDAADRGRCSRRTPGRPGRIALAPESATVYHAYTATAPGPFVAPSSNFLLDRTPRSEPRGALRLAQRGQDGPDRSRRDGSCAAAMGGESSLRGVPRRVPEGSQPRPCSCSH
jgi:hypothetical protein